MSSRKCEIVVFDAVFHAQMNNLFTRDRTYRVYVSPNKLLFVKIGQQNFDQHLAIHLGALGALIHHWLHKADVKKLQQRIVDYDQESAEDLIAADKQNFQLCSSDIEQSTVNPPSLFRSHGPCAGTWKLQLWDTRKMTFQFPTTDDMRTALQYLPTICRQQFNNNVEWNETKNQFQQRI